MIIRLLAIILLMIGTTGCSEAKQAEAVVVAKTGPRPPLALGINIGGLEWYNNNRVYANLILGNNWRFAPKGGNLQDLPPQYMDADGWLRPIPAGARAFRAMNQAALNVYETVRKEGTQKSLVGKMQTRDELSSSLWVQGEKQFAQILAADEIRLRCSR